MRIKTLVIASAMAVAAWPSLAQEAAPARIAEAAALRDLTLADAWRLAEAANPAIRAKQAELASAEGVRTDANALLFNNPELAAERTRRDVPREGLPDERRQEWSASLQQTLEIAGQRGHRRDAADAAMTALQEEIAEVRAQVRIEVAQQFYRILALQQRAEVEEQALGLFESTATAVQKRRAAGEDTKLDANVATVEAERARNQLAVAREQLLDARSDLAAKLQLSPDRLPKAGGDLRPVALAPYTLETLLGQSATQPRLRALGAREESARARLKLENAARYPDVTVGVAVGREGPTSARENLTTVRLSVPLPLFKRNAAGIGQASSALTQAEISRSAALRDTQAQVRSLWSKLESLKARVNRLQDRVLPALLDNQQLSVKSQRAGQIGLLELIVVNRQALDARRDLIDALGDYQTTRLSLELAAGWMEGVLP
ncbi:TolC family protein [Variovorax robiniae]|uniref:TolC family protein n=1 Tax=Variovorax robiniae TaxID=1836199 RepID=A0ABU8X7R6_9BURK